MEKPFLLQKSTLLSSSSASVTTLGGRVWQCLHKFLITVFKTDKQQGVTIPVNGDVSWSATSILLIFTVLLLHSPWTSRSCWTNHPVEFSFVDVGMYDSYVWFTILIHSNRESRTCNCMRKYHRNETRWTNTSLCAPCWSIMCWSRISSRSH
jgi:hypothetical protein